MLIKRISVLMMISIASTILFCQTAKSADKMLNVDVRQRPPEMIVEGNNYSGPLIDIIKEVAQKCGFKTKLRARQFKGSLEMLKKGDIDILPRTLCNQERAAVIDYLGPIGYQKRDILFIVKPGKESSINSYDDLKKLRVGIKRGTYYFKKFNDSTEIKKIETADDNNLVKMFVAGRFDTFIALDKKSAEAALKKNNIKEYAYANFKYPNRIGNYYGIAPHHEAYAKLQKALEQMVLSGRVKQIYEKHNVTPPEFESSMGFEGCFK